MDLFFLQLLLSFLVGGIWIAAASMLAEWAGTKIGGFIASLPSTIVVSMLFIGVTEGATTAVIATGVVPLIIGLEGIFLVVYALIVRRGLVQGLSAAFLVWLFASTAIVLVQYADIVSSLVAYVALLLFSYYCLEHVMHIPSGEKTTKVFSLTQLLVRAVLSGAVVTTTVLLTRLGGPILGGVMSTFPAAFIATLTIGYITNGWEFSRGLTKPLLCGTITIVVFALGVRFMYVPLGVFYGTFCAYVLSLLAGVIVYPFIQRLR
ncbi:MAG: DUF3147 family protein [Candidatus Woesearchaeota archaeon]|nr:DUF3147 family protein [Candidatus Woesearchaeota archaeon]